jgi:secondary thiamine-phosphate synthase enzyme
MPTGTITRIQIHTDKRATFVDVTPQIRQTVLDSGVRSGTCHVFVPHTTAGVMVNEGTDPNVARDILTHLDKLVPYGAAYTHREGNAAAHVKTALLGNAISLLVEGGDLILGSWQAVLLCEFDGPRERECIVRVDAV